MFKKIVSAVSATLLAVAVMPATALASTERYEVLTIGDEDEWVLELQKELNEQDYLEFPATGYFGTNTQNAVIKFQQDNNMIADGKAGPETRRSILGSSFSEIPDTREVKNVLTMTNTNEKQTEGMTITTEILGANTSSNADNTPRHSENALYPGDKGDAIATLQTNLKELEYYEYPNITGYYGPVTEAAVKKFQRTNGLTEDGIMHESALQLLESGQAKVYMMYPGDSGEDILQMQERLAELGYFSATPTGYYGDATVNAVKLFQDINGLTVDGKAGINTRSVLYSDNAKGLNDNNDNDASTEQPTPTPSQEDKASDTSTNPPQESTGEDDGTQEEVQEPEATPTPTPAATEKPSSSSSDVQNLLDVAHSQIGKPYSYGANGPNAFDCSGFVYYAMKNSGIAVSRLSSASYATQSGWKTISDINSLQVGDLVFFKSDTSDTISHMGIYLGGGSFIHSAPSSGGVAISGMSSGYYMRNYVTAKRIF